MVDKVPESADMILQLFGKAKGFAYQAGAELTKRVVETFNVVGQSSVFADCTMAFRRQDFGIRLPELGVKDSPSTIGRR